MRGGECSLLSSSSRPSCLPSSLFSSWLVRTWLMCARDTLIGLSFVAHNSMICSVLCCYCFTMEGCFHALEAPLFLAKRCNVRLAGWQPMAAVSLAWYLSNMIPLSLHLDSSWFCGVQRRRGPLGLAPLQGPESTLLQAASPS